MSRTTDQEIKSNPAKRFLKWENAKKEVLVEGEMEKRFSKGQFVYWDKTLEQNVEVPFPLKFVVLEKDTFNFSGYSKPENAYVGSNEVRRRWAGTGPNKEDLDLEITLKNRKTGNTVIEPFKVKDMAKMKPLLDSHGANKTESVYIAVHAEGEWQIWNLQLTKSQLSGGKDPKRADKSDGNGGWWEFISENKFKINKHFVEVTKFEARKSNMGNFGVPKFELGEAISEEEAPIFDKMDEELQEYLEWYLKKPTLTKEKEAKAKEEESYPSDWDSIHDEPEELV